MMNDLVVYLVERIRRVQATLGCVTESSEIAQARFADLFDSMALVEFLALLEEDCGVESDTIARCVGRRFGTVAELAEALYAAGIFPRTMSRVDSPGCLAPALVSEQTSGLATRLPEAESMPSVAAALRSSRTRCWFASAAVRLPEIVQSAATINAALDRPAGWLESRAGILQRHTWAGQDALAAAAEASRECLTRAGLSIKDVSVLLVTSEAPPLLTGIAAALHDRLQLATHGVALEIGGACTGFLAALWTAQSLLTQRPVVLVVAIEAPTQFLRLEPGPAGEAAALFGDAAAAVLLCNEPLGPEARRLGEVRLGADGHCQRLLQLERASGGAIELHMHGVELADRAIHAMAQSVLDMAREHELDVSELTAVVAHGGNGRMPALLARKLGIPCERVWSEAPTTGNLGSASVPAAWAMHQPKPTGPVIWTAVGAGLTWGAAMVDAR